MKKTVLALATLVSMSGAAMAQSSVTVFGIVDVAARSLKGDFSQKILNNEGRAASRLGFRGVEDMGGGLKASFHIEHGFNPDTGVAGTEFWQRRATVSLQGGFGEIRLGRHKTAQRLVVDDFDPYSTSGMPDMSRIYSGLTGSANSGSYPNRVNNQVGYHLPAMGPVYGTIDVSAGEGADANKSVTGRLGYKDKALHVALGYGQFGVANKLKSTTLGASYDFGSFMLMGMFSKNDRGSLDQKVMSVGGTVKIGGNGKLIASFAKADGNSTTVVAGTARQNADATLMAIGYDHSLSKRTSLVRHDLRSYR